MIDKRKPYRKSWRNSIFSSDLVVLKNNNSFESIISTFETVTFDFLTR